MARAKHGTELRRTVYGLLEQGPIGTRRARVVSRLIILLIIVNLMAAVLESVPALEARYGSWFAAIEWVSLVVFTAEYLARVWVAAEHAPNHHLPRARARLKFLLSAEGLIDLLA